MKIYGSLVLAVVASSICSLASATVITPTAATASSFYSNSGTTRLAGHTRDSSGLTAGSPWDTHTNDENPGGNFNDTMWLTSGAQTNGTANITWDLGALYSLTGFHLWNYNEAGTTARGVDTADILVSSDNSTYTPVTITVSNFIQASGGSTYAGEDYFFTSTLSNVQWVRFENISRFSGGDFAGGLSEIRFVTPVPEPGSMALVGCAAIFGLFRTVRRRRQN